MKSRILFIEDSDAQRKLISAGLREAGYEVYEAWSLESARRLLPSVTPRVVLLDLTLGEEDSGELLQEISRKNLGVIVVSANGHVDSRVECLKAGALDYVTKPVDMRELLLLINRLERFLPGEEEQQSEVDLGCIVFDIVARKVSSTDGRSAHLTGAEFNLFMVFLRAKGAVLSRSFISEKAFNAQYAAESRSVDLLVSKLRRKLNLIGQGGLLASVRNKGYRLWDAKLVFPVQSLGVKTGSIQG